MGIAKETCDICQRTIQMREEPTSVYTGKYLFCRNCIEKYKMLFSVYIRELKK